METTEPSVFDADVFKLEKELEQMIYENAEIEYGIKEMEKYLEEKEANIPHFVSRTDTALKMKLFLQKQVNQLEEFYKE